MEQSLEAAAVHFISWLQGEVVQAGSGKKETALEVEPEGRFWLGRLAPEASVVANGLGDRGERLDPCAIGVRLRPIGPAPWACVVEVVCSAWLLDDKVWRKSAPIRVSIEIVLTERDEDGLGRTELTAALRYLTGTGDLSCELRTEFRRDRSGLQETTLVLVNTSPSRSALIADTHLYECSMTVRGMHTEPFLLEALPDSFRFDRRIPAYGVNCGALVTTDGAIVTDDVPTVNRARPRYWSAALTEPDFSFKTLASNPMPTLHALVEALKSWGATAWQEEVIRQRLGHREWTAGMTADFKASEAAFGAEVQRIESGVASVESDPLLHRAFCLMNEAFIHSSDGRYTRWRPFQLGFLLSAVKCLTSPESEAETADVVWFATGGGKTETYLGLLVMAAFHDRLTGKTAGITAWSRFPLRMLSLQQTQRFANALAAAERARLSASIPGDPFSVGFFVGANATPNRINPDPSDPSEPDPNDDEMPGRYKVLLTCPFCHRKSITMAFDRLCWRLVHKCENKECEWHDRALPFYIVDQEIFRFLPTVVVGTIDKAAIISFQAAARGFVGAPFGLCSENGHGYTYAPRKRNPSGCLVPGCSGKVLPLPMEEERFAPSLRLQDELHLLRDSLGAVDAHYESLLDHLQNETSARRPKILASSATLTGYEKQVAVLYGRGARVFPQPGPTADESFWSQTTVKLARRFMAIAPRGVTLEFTVDRVVTILQQAVRRARAEPTSVAQEAGIDERWMPQLISLYGTHVVYGNALRDLDAAARSLETQVPVDGPLNTASLTGKTPFEEVRATLARLEAPEPDFADRIHVVTASSMMSHGVDLERLNVMIVLGLPLTTAEFIQSTSRVGRTWPGLVLVVHKIARERDAGVYRSFGHFVQHGDRFVEAVPVTRHSRRVLERVLPGVCFARMNVLYEARSGQSLTLIPRLRDYLKRQGVTAEVEAAAVSAALGFTTEYEASLREDVLRWYRAFFRNLESPPANARFPNELSHERPMLSLRDVEEEIPIYARDHA